MVSFSVRVYMKVHKAWGRANGDRTGAVLHLVVAPLPEGLERQQEPRCAQAFTERFQACGRQARSAALGQYTTEPY